jgi:hypothetical protein
VSLRSQLAAGFNSYDSTVNASKLNENSQVKKKKKGKIIHTTVQG